MASEWREKTLGEFVRLQRGHDLTASEQLPGPIPIMGSAGQNGFHSKATTNGPGVVIGRSGASAGKVHYCPIDFWAHNTVLYVTNFFGNNPRFAYYLLQTLDLASFNSGSAQPSLNRNYIYNIKLLVPPLEVQNEIVATMGAIDDKILLLQETNKSLEAIAQELFKSWFVDFDPVHAKAEGRDCEGVLHENSDLFPSEFEESELGAIPKGWRVASLDSIAEFLNGLAMQKFPVESDTEWLPVIKIAQLRKGDTAGADRASLSVPSEYVVQDDDVLFSWSGSLEVEIWCGGEGALNQHLFKVTSKQFPKWFYYLWTKYHLPSFRETAAHKATTMGHIQRGHLSEAKVIIPPDALLKSLAESISPLIQKASACKLEAKTLGKMRDVLLPRLISGKLRIDETKTEAQ
jgi:type I restriction enzyme S subunit